MNGNDFTAKKMDQVDRTVFWHYLVMYPQDIAFDFNNSALQRSTTSMSHFMFLLEYKIKIVLLLWGGELYNKYECPRFSCSLCGNPVFLNSVQSSSLLSN